MYRYFHLYEKNQTVEVDLVDGSVATTAPASEFEKMLGCKVREISRQKYQALNRAFDRQMLSGELM